MAADGMYFGYTRSTNPLADAAAATIRFALPRPALRSCRLSTTSAPQDSNSSWLVGSARPVSQPRLTRTHAPSFNSAGGIVDEIGSSIRMGQLADGAGLRALIFGVVAKTCAGAIRGGSLASAALSGTGELQLAEYSTCCMGGVIGLCCLQRRGR